MSQKKYLFMIMWIFVFSAFIFNTKSASAQIKISADSAIVMDVQSGAILYQKNMDKKQYPASITKIMTSLIALENSSMSETITYSRNAVTNLESGASNINLQPGEKLSMKDSLYAIMLMSANEACNGVAENLYGSIENYVKVMNDRAKELGCTGTHFANVNGLWLENHYTTAHDMALISREAYKNSEFAQITGTKYYKIGPTNKAKAGHSLHNHHGMLVPITFPQYEYEYCVGGKTGYTRKCRYTLVTYAKKNGMTLVSVVMRAESPYTSDYNEYSDSIKILNHCFENYKRHKIAESTIKEVTNNSLFTNYSPFYSKSETPLKIDEDTGVLLPKGADIKDTEKKVVFYDAPHQSEGKNVIGRLVYTYNDTEVGGSDIYYTPMKKEVLDDSIDMSQWFEEAIETAKTEVFPWDKIILIIVFIITLSLAIFIVIMRMRAEKENRERKRRYRKINKKKNYYN